MNKEKEYKGYFRKGWFLYTLIKFLSIVSALGFIYIGTSQGGTGGFIVASCGFMFSAIGGSLMSVMVCHDYINSGEDRL